MKTSNAFLRLDFQKLSHFRFVHKDNANGVGGSSGSWKSRTVIIFQNSCEIVRKFPCMEAAKFTRHFGTFCLRPCTDVFGRCAQQRVKTLNLSGNMFRGIVLGLNTQLNLWRATVWVIFGGNLSVNSSLCLDNFQSPEHNSVRTSRKVAGLFWGEWVGGWGGGVSSVYAIFACRQKQTSHLSECVQ